MRKHKSKLKSFLVAILCCLGILVFLTISMSQQVYAYSHQCENESECYELDSHVYDLGDILEGDTGSGYSLEQEYQQALAQAGIMSPNAVQSNNSCDTHSTSCGPGRENGFSSTFLSTGCRNWEGWSYGNYGATDIPFWIDMPSMNTIANTTHRNILINDIRTQAALWNDAVMHDGTGQIVNLYEVGIGSNTRPANINGRRVVEVMRRDGDYAGQFKPPWLFSPAIEIRINYNASGGGDRPGRNVDTPMHEFGHLLGLYDLDDGHTNGTHKTLMGYSRGTTVSTVVSAIKYQDIQGLAVLNNRHTTHHWNRYVVNGNHYLHFCFYCDTVDSVTSAKSGSAAMVNASTCTHNYRPMVSHGDRHWLKCTRCYKVVESNFLIEGVSGSPITLRINGLSNNSFTSITIPSSIGGQSVKYISDSAFINKTHLSQITIPSSVTHIGSNAFQNTNNASIYLTGRTSAPSTFNINWNSSANPVYLNGNLCNHASKTTISLNDTQHGDLCNNCRTITNKANHNKYTSGLWKYCYNCPYSKYIGHTHTYAHTWLNLRQHVSSCLCGSNVTRPHIVSSDWNGVGYATCLDCGGPAELGIVIMSGKPVSDEVLFTGLVSEYFGNGSFILENGVIVLSDEDLEKYYDGTLVLPDCCGSLACDGHCDDCIDCDYHQSEIDDNIYLYFDRRGFNYNYYLNRKDEDFFKRQ